MNVTKEINRKEAIAILCRYYGQDIMFSIYETENESLWAKSNITANLIKSMESEGYIKQFRFTSLRSIDEMTEDEKAEYKNIQEEFMHIFGVDGDWEKTASESIDYLRAQGIATNNEHLNNYIIKD